MSTPARTPGTPTDAVQSVQVSLQPVHVAPEAPFQEALVHFRGVGHAASSLLLAAACLATGACAQVALAEHRPITSMLEIRRQHVVVQKFDLSCGAAALTTLLNFQHGEHLTEREVAIGLMQRKDYVDDPALVRRREGFSLLDLKRYVQSRGYDGVGFGNLTWSDLLHNVPVMVPVNLMGYNHFVVFRGVVNGRVSLADPAWGNRTLPETVFRKAWIDYPELGKVGFVVKRRGPATALNGLASGPGVPVSSDE